MRHLERGLVTLFLSLGFITGCTTTSDESRQLSNKEMSDLQEFVGSYTGNILPRKTANTDVKPLASDVKLKLDIKDDTLVLTSDKDLSGGECSAEVGRLMSLNFSEHSFVATFAYESSDCPLPPNVAEIAVEAKVISTGEHRLTTKLPKAPSSRKASKAPHKPVFLFGIFMKDEAVEEQP